MKKWRNSYFIFVGSLFRFILRFKIITVKTIAKVPALPIIIHQYQSNSIEFDS